MMPDFTPSNSSSLREEENRLASFRETKNGIVIVCLILFLACFSSVASAQVPTPLGNNHPELTWREIETEHFRLIYHEEIEGEMQDAAKMAEEAYRVVTGNLGVEMPGKTRIYFSDNDAVKNAFAFLDDYIFIWMRGILDDHPYAVRSSGTSKWLRSVITHEFTHTVLAHATKGTFSWLFPSIGVPRWFNEGTARMMEPDGWTTDLDMVLRVAASTGQLDLGSPGNWQGALMYEGGHSLVRHIVATYGDSALKKIVNYDKGFSYDFGDAVKDATGKPMDEIYLDWQKRVNVFYNTQFGTKIEIEEMGRRIPTGLDIVHSVRVSPDGKKYAMFGKKSLESPTLLYFLRDDESGDREFIDLDVGYDFHISWSPDSRYLLLSKLHYGDRGRLLYDLYELDIYSEDIRRLTDDGEYEDAEFSPDGKYIVAVRTNLSGSDLWLLDRNGTEVRKLTNFNNKDVSVYWPRWHPNSDRVAFSVFDEQGRRDIAIAALDNSPITYLQRDSTNDRYPVWSPLGNSMVYISYANGLPNIYRHQLTDSKQSQLTDVAGGVMVWDWSQAKDSLLVTSVDDRNHTRVYWIPNRNRLDTLPSSEVRGRYSIWRDVKLPMQTRSMSEVPAITPTQPEGYSALAHTKPLLFLPVIGSDKSQTGDLGTRWGLANIWADPMGKHNFAFFADYGDASKQFSGSITYQNNTLRPSILLNVGSVLAFSGVIDHVAYYEREESAGLGLIMTWPTMNSLTNYFFLLAGADYRQLKPWNEEQYGGTVSERRPIRANIGLLGGRFGYVTEDFLTSLTYTHSDKAYESDLTYSRYRLGLSYRYPFTPDRNVYLAAYGRALANFGDELPQEFLGLIPYDVFEGGVNLRTAPLQDRLRGIRKYVYGNRLVIASAELRTRDVFFQHIITPLQAFNPYFTYFIDVGSAWYADKPANNQNVEITEIGKTQWSETGGVELRSELAPGSSISFGVAWELVKRAQPDWYLRTVLEW